MRRFSTGLTMALVLGMAGGSLSAQNPGALADTDIWNIVNYLRSTGSQAKK